MALRPFSYPVGEGEKPVLLWDLPGQGTLQFPVKNYFKTIGLMHFDIVLLLTSQGFTGGDFALQQELRRLNKMCLVVHTQTDLAVENNEDTEGKSEEVLMFK